MKRYGYKFYQLDSGYMRAIDVRFLAILLGFFCFIFSSSPKSRFDESLAGIYVFTAFFYIFISMIAEISSKYVLTLIVGLAFFLSAKAYLNPDEFFGYGDESERLSAMVGFYLFYNGVITLLSLVLVFSKTKEKPSLD